MREIKFRAFDFYSMRYDVTGLEFYADGKLSGVFIDGDYFNTDDDRKFNCVYNKAKLMQYTGMHDKNGVQIYEGDVLSDHVGIGVVEYSEKRASFRVNYGDGLCKWFIDYNLKGELESIEVIGNIHQHAYLLEQNKC